MRFSAITDYGELPVIRPHSALSESVDSEGDASTGDAAKWPMVVLRAVLLSLAGAYVLQTLTPLRLCPDAVGYLSAASSVSDGSGFPSTQLQVGYSLIIVALEWLGAATSFGLVSFNLIVLSLGLVCFYYLLIQALGLSVSESMTVCTLALLSWVTIKHVTLPLSDILYMCASGVALLAMTATLRGQRRTTWWLIPAVLLCMLAISIRWVGLALLPALAWTIVLIPGLREYVTRLIRRRFILATLIGSALLIVAVLAGWVLLSVIPSYVPSYYLIGYLRGKGIWTTLKSILNSRLIELGEISMNLPATKVPIAEQVFRASGALVLIVLAMGYWSQFWKGTPISVYWSAYLIVLLAWPSYDSRFWLPVIPLLFAYSYLGFRRIRLISAKPVLYSYLAVFLITGGAALWYSSQITLAGNRFPERYGNDEVKDTYRAAFGQPFDERQVDWKALSILKRYGSFRTKK